MDIKSTKNYKMFKTIDGNRGLNRKYLSRLSESISNNNLLALNPIIVNKNMEVLDGQHRLKAAEIMGIDIYYVVSDNGGLPEVQMLNSNVRGWTITDFLNSHLRLHKKDYKILKDFSEKNGISISNSLRLLTGGFRKDYRETEVLTDFRNGDFKVTHLNYANDFAKKLRDVSKYIEQGTERDRNFIIALTKVYLSGITHETLMEKFEKTKERLHRNSNVKEYVRDLEDILSWKSRNILRLKKGY